MSPGPRRFAPLIVAAWWAALLIAVIALRPLTPVDETRYLSVAWEMHRSGNLLQLFLNGALYGHKPPLLFWLLNLGWTAFGVNEWWPRLLTALFGLGALSLSLRLARMLAPEREDVAAMTLFIAASSLYWMAFIGAVMFDLMLAFFVLWAMISIAKAAAEGGWRFHVVAGVALGLGILSKGPVALLHVLPLALLAPWWSRIPAAGSSVEAAALRGPRWYGGVLLMVLVGALIALAWAVPAALAGGGAFGREIFWSQSVDRMVNTRHHLRPVWFYVAFLPVLLLPWLFFPATWRGALALVNAPSMRAVRFALAWTVPVFIGFSLFKGKQVQYLLPEVPAFALLVAAGLSQTREVRRWEAAAVALVFVVVAIALAVLANQPRLAHMVTAGDRPLIWLTVSVLAAAGVAVAVAPLRDRVVTVAAIGTAAVAMVVGAYAGVGRAIFEIYDVHPVSRYLARVQQDGRPIAHFPKYHGQFQFVGRLERPLQVFESPQPLLEWAQRHPQGAVVIYSRQPLAHPGAQPEFRQPFRGQTVYVWRAADLQGVSDQWYQATPAEDADTD